MIEFVLLSSVGLNFFLGWRLYQTGQMLDDVHSDCVKLLKLVEPLRVKGEHRD